MDIYYYCSYTGSPVGFYIGKLTSADRYMETTELTGGNVPLLLSRCFTQGVVCKAFGQLEQGSYFFLIKGLSAKGTDPMEPAEYFINFAFVTDKASEFEQWMKRTSDSEQSIADAIKDTVQIDEKSRCGFLIRGSAVQKLVQMSFGSLFYDIKPQKDTVCFELISEKTDLSELAEALGLNEYKYCRHIQGKWFQFSKKKRVRLLVLLGMIVFAAGLLFILISTRR